MAVRHPGELAEAAGAVVTNDVDALVRAGIVERIRVEERWRHDVQLVDGALEQVCELLQT